MNLQTSRAHNTVSVITAHIVMNGDRLVCVCVCVCVPIHDAWTKKKVCVYKRLGFIE